MSINFSGSFEKKDGFLSQIAKKKMKENVNVISMKKQRQLMKVIDKMEAEFDFYSDEVKKSKKLPELYFTNYLHETTKEDIKTGIYSIFTDQSIVDTLKGDFVRLNPKIINCLRLYYPSINSESEIFKSNLQDAAGAPKPVRIFTISEIDTAQHKATFKIVLIDPFHLVIPSEMWEHGVVNKSKDQMEKDTYNKNQNNTICMTDHIKRYL